MKEEEEQAKRINQRFHKRLGLNKPQLVSQPAQANNGEEQNANNEQQHKRHAAYEPPANDEYDQEFKLNKQQFNKLEENAFDNFDQSQLIKPSFSSAFIANDLASDDSTNEFKLDTSKIVFSSINNNQNDLFANGNSNNAVASDDEIANDNHLNVNGTPPIVITRTFSITESTQTTTVVPMFIGNGLINQTITESFIIRKTITAFKTMPPGDLITLETDDPSQVPKLNETYTFSNLHLLSDIKPTAAAATASNQQPVIETSINNLPFLNKMIDLNNPLIIRAALQTPRLAAIYFGLQQLQQQATSYNTITKPTTSLTSSTVHQTKKISFYDGRQTRTRYLTDSGVLVTSTITILTTEVLPIANSQILSQQSKLQQMFANELLVQNTAMPNLFQTPLDNSNKPIVADNLQPMASNQNLENQQNIKPEASLSSDSQISQSNSPSSQSNNNNNQQLPNALQSSFQQQQTATNLANLLQPQQNQFTQTATLPSFANLPNIAPYLNPNANLNNLNEVANILSNLQRGNLNRNQLNNNNNMLLPTRYDTATITTQSMVTKTNTKIYTLIYNGFSTRYR